MNEMIPVAIVVHHSKGPDGIIRDWPGITRYHTSYRYRGEIVTPSKAALLAAAGKSITRPWLDNGYNFGIEYHNSSLAICYGRSPYIIGAHCLGMNSKSIGLCFVGDFDIDVPTDEHYKAGGILCAMIIYMFPTISNNNIYPHNKYNQNKSCPGRNFDMDRLMFETNKHQGRKNVK